MKERKLTKSCFSFFCSFYPRNGDKRGCGEREKERERGWKRRGKERGYQERKVSGYAQRVITPAKPTILLVLPSPRVSCSLPHPRDVHFCSLARLQGQRNMGWSARKWRNYIRGREKGGCKSKRRLLSLSLSRERNTKLVICRIEKFGRERDIDPVGNEGNFGKFWKSR